MILKEISQPDTYWVRCQVCKPTLRPHGQTWHAGIVLMNFLWTDIM